MVVPQINKMTNGSGECLKRATAHYALPPRGNYELWAPPRHSLRSRALKDVQFSIVARSIRIR